MSKYQMPDGNEYDFIDDNEATVAMEAWNKQFGGGKEEGSWYDKKVPQTLQNMVGIGESLVRAIPNIPQMAHGLGLKAVEKFAVPDNLLKDYQEMSAASLEKFPHVKPITEESALADEMLGESIKTGLRAPAAGLLAAFSGTGQSGAKDIISGKTQSTLADILEVGGEGGMLVAGGRAVPHQVKSVLDTMKSSKGKVEPLESPSIVEESIQQRASELQELQLDQYKQKFAEELQRAESPEFIGDALPREMVQKYNPLLELVERGEEYKPGVLDTERLATRHEGVPTIDFPLRQEVLESFKPTTDAFRQEATRLEKAVEKQENFLKDYEGSKEAIKQETELLQQLQEQLSSLKTEFGRGMEQLGIREASDAYGRGLYEARGDKTTYPVEYTFEGRKGVGAKEGGAIDPELLGLKRIGEGLKGIQVFRALSKEEGAGGQVQAGQWVTPSKDTAVNVYAKGDASRVIEDYIPARDLYEVHPDGWVYSPKGTDLTNVKRTRDTTFGQMAKGKGQRGSIGFKKNEQMTVEEYRKQFKEKTGMDLPVEKAIEDVKKINEQLGTVQQKLQKTEGTTKLAKVTGLKNIMSKEPLTPQEAKVAMELGRLKDIDSTMLGKALNLPMKLMASGTYGLRNYYNNPLVEAMLRPVGDAFAKTEAWGNTKLWGMHGVARKLTAMKKPEFIDVYNRLVEFEGKDVPMETVLEGMSIPAKEFITEFRKLQEESLQIKNEFRATQGRKPITPRANYLSGSFFGDNVILALDSKGQVKAVLSGYKSDLTAAQKWVTENHPDLVLSDPVSNIRTGQKPWEVGNLADLLDSILKKEDSIQEALISHITEARKEMAADMKGVGLHEKFKQDIAVMGAEGFKPWKDALTNAEELFKSQLHEMENAVLRTELAKASQNIEAFNDTLGRTNAAKLAETKIEAALGQSNWMKQWEGNVATALNELGYGGEVMLKALREGKSPMKGLMNIAAFSGDAAFALMNILETGKTILSGTTHVMFEQPLKTQILSVYGGMPLSWGMMKGTIASITAAMRSVKGDIKFMDESSQYFHDYLMKENIGNPTIESKIEVAPKGTKEKAMNYAKDVLDVTIKAPEYIQRYVAGQTMAHTFESLGMTRENAAKTAVDMVKHYAGDYTSYEKPMLYQRLGTVGEMGHQWRTWLHKELTNHVAAFKKGDVGTLATMLAYQGLVFGVMSAPAFSGIDQLFRWVRTQAAMRGGNSELMAKVGETLSPVEWLKANYDNKPFRGYADQLMEALGADGSTSSRTEWRFLPESLVDVFPAVSFGGRLGGAVGIAGKELASNIGTPESLDYNALTKPIQQVSPKMLGRMLEYKTGTEGKNNEFLLNPERGYGLKAKFANEAEKRAYIMGAQPKSRAENQFEQGLLYKKTKEQNDIKLAANEKLVEVINRGILRKEPDYGEKLTKAVNQYIYAHKSDQGLQNIIQNLLMELNAPPSTIQKLQSLNNPSNVELNKFITKVVPEIQTYNKPYQRN